MEMESNRSYVSRSPGDLFVPIFSVSLLVGLGTLVFGKGSEGEIPTYSSSKWKSNPPPDPGYHGDSWRNL
jgi:hypothetical protein